MRKSIVLPMLCLALASCAGQTQIGGAPDVSVVQGTGLPVPATGMLANGVRQYLIGPYDKLRIDVYGIDDLKERTVQVDASGRVAFPLVGSIDAAGKAPNELAEIIQKRLRDAAIRNPQVTVNLEETFSQLITVDGAVIKPGLYPVIGKMTLIRAVATAQGLNQDAKQSEVVVFRTVDGKKYAALYDLRAIRKGAYGDPELFANDVVVVGDSQARKLFRDLIAASPLITTPLILLFR